MSQIQIDATHPILRFGKTKRFRPGQPLHPSHDAFIREIVQPIAQTEISPIEDRIIEVWAVSNVIIFTTFSQLFSVDWDLEFVGLLYLAL